jgi:transaldolase/glucose-6-phosphate isomerase
MTIVNRPGTLEAGNALKQLEAFGQSPWLDFIQRSFTESGLQELIDRDGLKGITSNPAIFEKAMGHGADYDAGFKALAAAGDHDAQTLYETLAIEDIQRAADKMRPVYDATGKVDGYISLEVSPYLAMQTEATIHEARRLWAAVGRDNLMVKVPGTAAGVPAIHALIADGININVTLLFAQSAYEAVAEAFIAGLEDRLAKGGSIAGLSSVASFFVSRIDAVIDGKIDARVAQGEEGLKALRGKVAIANAKMAYQTYLKLVASPRWQALAAHGALPQRLLWASTGVKDKAYSDVLYVEELIGRDTVNTIPPATMDAFRDHGKVRESLTENVDAARQVLADADKAGLDLPGVAAKLVQDGVTLFAEAADKLLGAVAARRTAMLGDRLATLTLTTTPAVAALRETWRKSGAVRDLWAGDAKVWTGADEAKWLGWLRVVADRMADLPALLAFQNDVKAAGFSHVLLLGMGGSSLGPEVFAETFGRQPGFPELLVLDSTDPQQIAAFAARVDMAKTLCIVSSKSGSTLEPNILKAFFWDRMTKAVGAKAGQHFVAVTDPGSKMQAVAEGDRFRRIFMGDPAIGGRYSVLSNFGLVPAAAMGVDIAAFLQSAALMVNACAAGAPPDANPGVQLGLVLGEACKAGRDKVTIVSGPGLVDVGAWLEQLLAESTGKQGHGIVPVDQEPLAAPAAYGADRLFAYLTVSGQANPAQDAAIAALEAAGQPVVRLVLGSAMQVGQAFYLWEFATAVAGSVIGINPFDQPDVEASKIETRKLTDAYAKDGHLPPEAPFLEADGIKLFTDAANQTALGGGGLDAVIKAHLSRAGAGDYVALLAYIQRDASHIAALTALRTRIRDAKRVATCVGFGPRFLHSTGQTYKGGPNSGVILQITADDAADLPVPGEKFTFGIVKAAQARGDFDVLAERHRRALRVHLGSDVGAGLNRLAKAIAAALS